VHKQAVITLEEVTRIKNEAASPNVFYFANVFGPWFTKANLP